MTFVLDTNVWSEVARGIGRAGRKLSTVPLTTGLVATFFGPKWMTMLYGIVFLSHQTGAFLGAWLGGLLFDRLQSYDAMWWISVGLGVFAALVHVPIIERPVARLAAAGRSAL